MAKEFKLATKASLPHKSVFLGVLSGISNYTNADPTALRLVLCFLVIFYGVGIGLYILMWLLGLILFGYE